MEFNDSDLNAFKNLTLENPNDPSEKKPMKLGELLGKVSITLFNFCLALIRCRGFVTRQNFKPLPHKASKTFANVCKRS